jgi:hypothetical protein
MFGYLLLAALMDGSAAARQRRHISLNRFATQSAM